MGLPACRETCKNALYFWPLSRGRKRLFCTLSLPSEKILKEKEAFVASLREKMESSVAGVIVDYKGINVADDTKLRKELREAGVEYFVVKNTMLRLAVKETGLAGLADVLKGSTALAVSKEDPTAAARILNKFAEGSKGKFSLKSGYMEGKVLDEAELTAIAKLPDYKGMLSMFAGALTSTLSGLAVAMQAYVDKQEEPAA